MGLITHHVSTFVNPQSDLYADLAVMNGALHAVEVLDLRGAALPRDGGCAPPTRFFVACARRMHGIRVFPNTRDVDFI